MFCTIFPQILSLEIILKQAETIAPMLLPKKPCSNELRNILVELQTVKFAKKKYSNADIILWILWCFLEKIFCRIAIDSCFCSKAVQLKRWFANIHWYEDGNQAFFPDYPRKIDHAEGEPKSGKS